MGGDVESQKGWEGRFVLETSESGSVCSGAAADDGVTISSITVVPDVCKRLICLTLKPRDSDSLKSVIQWPSCEDPREFVQVDCDTPCEQSNLNTSDGLATHLQTCDGERRSIYYMENEWSTLVQGSCLKATVTQQAGSQDSGSGHHGPSGSGSVYDSGSGGGHTDYPDYDGSYSSSSGEWSGSGSPQHSGSGHHGPSGSGEWSGSGSPQDSGSGHHGPSGSGEWSGSGSPQDSGSWHHGHSGSGEWAPQTV